MTDWIDDAANSGNERQQVRAGETAQAHANYLGNHGEDLLHLQENPGEMNPGSISVGEQNHSLVQGYAEALIPYQGALVLAACGATPPSLPADQSPAAVHDLLTGDQGQDFLYDVSSHDWDDDGARASELFGWIAADATSADPAVATRAGEAAHAVAAFLSHRGPELLDIRTGWFGRNHKTVSALNPDLVRAFAPALVPYRGAMVCDLNGTKGFELLASPCEAAVQAAKPIFEVLNTDPQAAKSFADGAYARMDGYLQLLAANDPNDPAIPSYAAGQGLSYVGRLLGLVTAGAAYSEVEPPTIEQELTQARYLTGKAMIARDPGLRFPPQYFANGVLMTPAEVRHQLGDDMVDDFAFTLTDFLIGNGNVEQLISHNLCGQYESVAGAQGGSK